MNSLRNLPSLTDLERLGGKAERLALHLELDGIAVRGERIELGLAASHGLLRDALDQARLLELLHVVVDGLVVELQLARDHRRVVRPLRQEAKDPVAQPCCGREEAGRVGVC